MKELVWSEYWTGFVPRHLWRRLGHAYRHPHTPDIVVTSSEAAPVPTRKRGVQELFVRTPEPQGADKKWLAGPENGTSARFCKLVRGEDPTNTSDNADTHGKIFPVEIKRG